MTKLAFGCSHTAGVGVDPEEAWPFLIGAENYGVSGTSSDFLVRRAPDILSKTNPTVVYVLWPDWTRFEYTDAQDRYQQSLPTDSNRIHFMETATDEWLMNNFDHQVKKMKDLCASKRIKLVDMALYDLIPYIDHADRWPLSKLGHHYSPVWHQWVADIFKQKENEQT
jgi:hypothetical protein